MPGVRYSTAVAREDFTWLGVEPRYGTRPSFDRFSRLPSDMRRLRPGLAAELVGARRQDADSKSL